MLGFISIIYILAQYLNTNVNPNVLIYTITIFTTGASVGYSYFRLDKKISLLNYKLDLYIKTGVIKNGK